MAQPLFTTILTLILFAFPGKEQSIDSFSLSLQDASPSPTAISENSGGFPPGCKLYKNKKLLQCRNAQLQAIPELKESWKLEIVDLSRNNISSVQFGDGYKNVKSIHLERNNITTIKKNFLFQLQHFHLLSIGGNPFHCDCKLEWLRERLLGLHDNFPRIIHIEDLICASPAGLEGRTLVNLSKEQLCGIKPEDKLLRSTTPTPTTRKKSSAELTAEAELIKARQTAMEKGRIAEIIGVTLSFAAVIVIMSVAFIIM